MSETSPYPPAHVPERELPIPTTLSAEAQAVLNMMQSRPPLPALDPRDLDAWRAIMAERGAPEAANAIALVTTGSVATGVPVETTEIALSKTVVHIGTPEGLPPDDDRVLLSIHGGGFTDGGGAASRAASGFVAGSYRVTTWNVDYRMLPDHPFPAGLDDCLEAYRLLLERHDPTSIVVSGVSAGGNLSAALLLRAQDEGLAMPAAVVLNAPAVDLTLAGDSVRTNSFGSIAIEDDFSPTLKLYAGGHDPRDPYLSPLFGEIGTDWPPTLLLTGTRDFMLSDTVRMHRAILNAGARAELHVFEAAPHGMFAGHAPEDHALVAQVRHFLDDVWQR